MPGSGCRLVGGEELEGRGSLLDWGNSGSPQQPHGGVAAGVPDLGAHSSRALCWWPLSLGPCGAGIVAGGAGSFPCLFSSPFGLGPHQTSPSLDSAPDFFLALCALTCPSTLFL